VVRFRTLPRAVLEEEGLQLGLDRRIEVLAHHDRRLRQRRGGPDHLHLVGDGGIFALGEHQPDGVVGHYIQHAVGRREQIGLVAGLAHHREALLRVDIVGNEDVGHRRQGAGRRLGVADAKGVFLAALQHVIQRDARAFLDQQDRGVGHPLAVGAGDAAQHLAICPAHGLKGRQGRKPAQLDLVELHRLDLGGVVAGVMRLHVQAGLLVEIVQQRPPDLLHGLLVFGRGDGEVQHRRRGLGAAEQS